MLEVLSTHPRGPQGNPSLHKLVHSYSRNSCYLLSACFVLFSLLRSSCETYFQAPSLPWDAKLKFLAE